MIINNQLLINKNPRVFLRFGEKRLSNDYRCYMRGKTLEGVLCK